MFTQSLVFAGLVLAAPPEAGTGPKLEKGLEVQWTGTFTEASFRPGVRAVRTYDVQTRLFVLDTGDYGAEAVLFTRVFLKPDRKSMEPPAGVVRLELVRIDPKGKVSVLPSPADPDNPAPKARPWPPVQLSGLPTHEAGVFFEHPDKPLKPGLAWAREDGTRPVVNWKVADADSFHGQPALKVVAEQKTAGYFGDRIRQTEWRKQETLTVHPTHGYALRLERVIEKRDPEADELSFRSVLKLEQQGKMTYAGRLYDERREEGLHAAAFTAMLDRSLATGGREGPKPFEAVARRTQVYLADHADNYLLPYREAVFAVQKRAESAAKGNLPPAPPPEEPAAPVDPLEVGKPIPDLTAPGLSSFEAIKLSALKGKPVVLAYFQPLAPSGLPVLKLADELHARKLAAVVPLAIGRPKDARALIADLRTTVPVYDGTDVYKAHGLEATPVIIVIDKDGVVRHVARGWGAETAAAVTKEVERWAK
jgi:peroxiredoxin